MALPRPGRLWWDKARWCTTEDLIIGQGKVISPEGPVLLQLWSLSVQIDKEQKEIFRSELISSSLSAVFCSVTPKRNGWQIEFHLLLIWNREFYSSTQRPESHQPWIWNWRKQCISLWWVWEVGEEWPLEPKLEYCTSTKVRVKMFAEGWENSKSINVCVFQVHSARHSRKNVHAGHT